jgi:hypothetical protein
MDWYVDSEGGDWVIYHEPTSEDGGNIHHLELALPTRLAPCGWGPTWSAAGDQVAFEAPYNMLDWSDPNDNSCVWVADPWALALPVNVSGDGVPPDLGDAHPTWSPDEAKLAFRGPFDLFGLPPDWPPEWGECGMSSIWIVDPAGIDPPQNICAPHHGVRCADQPDWGAPPDGMGGTEPRIAFRSGYEPVSGTFRSDICTDNLEGTDRVYLTTEQPESWWIEEPRWSPDGTKLRYAIWETAVDTREFWVMDYDGGNKVQLCQFSGSEWWEYPVWSPDSTMLAYPMGEGVHLVNADGLPPDPQPIPHVPWVAQISSWPATTPWASDGSLLTVSTCAAGGQDPVLLKADGYVPSGYMYEPTRSEAGWTWSTGSMTAAALWSLRVCGVAVADYWVQNGLEWLASNYAYDENPGGQGEEFHYYYLWTAAKGLTVCDVHELPGVAHMPVDLDDEPAFDSGWYYDFSKYLLTEQDDPGSWHGDSLDTCLSLLILATPVSQCYQANELLAALIADVAASDVQQGVKNTLIKELEHAVSEKDAGLEYLLAGETAKAGNRLDTAAEVLAELLDYIASQRGKKIAEGLADEWSARASDIMERLTGILDD